jgi:hypothetical protein
MTLTREEAQQVLECMETAIKAGDWVVDGVCDPDFILYMLRTRLAQPESEPMAWMHDQKVGFNVPLYTAPPHREWQTLTSTERKVLWKSANNPKEYADLLEAKLKEKNT